MAIQRHETSLESSDAKPAEVLLKAPHVGVPTIDSPPFRCCRSKQWTVGRIGTGQFYDALRGEVVKIAGERLELGDDSQNVGMRYWPPYLAPEIAVLRARKRSGGATAS